MFFPFIITSKLYFNHHGNFLGGENVEEGTIHYRRIKTTCQAWFPHYRFITQFSAYIFAQADQLAWLPLLRGFTHTHVLVIFHLHRNINLHRYNALPSLKMGYSVLRYVSKNDAKSVHVKPFHRLRIIQKSFC